MVAGDQTDESALPAEQVPMHIFVQETVQVAPGFLMEIAPGAVPHEGAVAAAPGPFMVQVEVSLELRLAQGFLRVAPLCHQHRLGKLLCEHGLRLAPQGGGSLLAGVILDQAVGHVHPEAIAALAQPEAHHRAKTAVHQNI